MKLPTSISLAVTFRCNSRCAICSIWKKKTKKDLSPDFYQKLPKSLKDIDIVGGEPFLREDLVEIVAVLRQRCKQARILIVTNGFLPEKIAKMVSKIMEQNKNVAIRVSLDGVGRVHDKIRGVPGAYIKAKETLVVLRNLGLKDLGIIFTLTRLNEDELPKVLSFSRKNKLKFSCNIVHDSKIYFGEGHLRLRPSVREVKENLHLVKKNFVPSFNPKSWVKAWFYQKLADYAKTNKRPLPCGAGKNFFYLDPSGNVYMCQFKNWKIGNIKNQQFLDIWRGAKRKKYLPMANRCNDCFMVCTTKDEIKKNKLKIIKDFLNFLWTHH